MLVGPSVLCSIRSGRGEAQRESDMRLDSNVKATAQRMATAEGIPLNVFVSSLIGAEERSRAFDAALPRKLKAMRKLERKHGGEAFNMILAAVKAGRRSVAGVSLAAWH